MTKPVTAEGINKRRIYNGWRKYCLSVSKSIYLLLKETNEKENAVYATSINSVSPHGIYSY